MSKTMQKLIHGHHPGRAREAYAGALAVPAFKDYRIPPVPPASKKRPVDLTYQQPTKRMPSPSARRSKLTPKRRRRRGIAGCC